MEIFSEAPKSFKIHRKSPEAAKLKSSISDQLLLFLGYYTDDILAEYITVLVCNGKNQIQAKDDLEAFLGKRSGAFVSWLWGHLAQYELPCKDASPSSCVGDRNLRRNSGEVNAHRNAYADSSLTKNTNNFHTSSCVPPYEIELSEIKEVCKIPFESSSRIGTNKEQLQKHGRINRKVADIAEKLGGDTSMSSAATIGNSQSFEQTDKSKLNVCPNENGLACRVPDFPRSGTASNILQSVSAERAGNQDPHGEETYAANISASNPLSTLVYGPCQKKMPRVSVWDRLGKPHKEISVVKDKPLDAHFGDIVKKDYEAEDKTKVPIPVQNENLDWRIKNIVHLFDKSFEANCYSEDGKHEHSVNTIIKPYTEENIRRKRTYSDISFAPSPLSASSVDPNCVDDHFKGRLHNSKKLNSSTEIGAPVPLSQMKYIRQKLQQIEMEVSQLRSNQQGMNKERPPPVPSNPGVIKYSSEDANLRTVFASNVHFTATKEDLSSHFGKCGEVSDVTFTDNRKGSAYITFASKVSVEKAVALSGTSFFSRPLKVVRKKEEAMLTTTKPSLSAVKPLVDRKPFQEHVKTSLWKPFNPPKVHHHLQWRRNPIPTPSQPSQPSTAG